MVAWRLLYKQTGLLWWFGGTWFYVIIYYKVWLLLGFAKTDIKIYSLHALLINMFSNVLQKEKCMFIWTVIHWGRLAYALKLLCFPLSPSSLRVHGT